MTAGEHTGETHPEQTHPEETHPEETIDRALRGQLEPGERASLEQHLDGCSACAAHLKHASRFRAELDAPPRAELLERRALEGAVARMRATAIRRRSVPIWMRSAAAGLLLLAGAGAAALLGKSDPPPPPPAPAATPVHALGSPAQAPAPAPAPAETPPPNAALPPVSTSTVSAAALFRRAGELRRQGRALPAIAVYRQLQRSHPQTREARLSFALAGQLLLDGGRSGEALSQFDRYLATGSEVDEEALAGRASALERLGRTPDAAAAWKKLLDRHPDSVYAETARARLQRLSTGR
jgi:anti-sigma factor RsiW